MLLLQYYLNTRDRRRDDFDDNVTDPMTDDDSSISSNDISEKGSIHSFEFNDDYQDDESFSDDQEKLNPGKLIFLYIIIK